jgi:hypothetical protein
MMNAFGFTTPSLVTLAQYHPQFALAVLNGVAVRPNLRPLSIELQNSQIGQPQPASFQEVISQYSIFAGVGLTIDPTNNIPGNPLKTLADGAQPLTTGVTVNMLVKTNDPPDYSPIPDDTPLQSLPAAFAPSIGIWRMVNPENVKVRFTLQTPAEGDPFTVWLVFCFLVLGAQGTGYLQMTAADARAALAKMGYGPPVAA